MEFRFLRSDALKPRHAYALAAARHRGRKGHPITAPVLCKWLDWSPSKARRVARDLVEGGLLTRDGHLTDLHETWETLGSDGEPLKGHLKVRLRWLPLGDLEALLLAQLPVWGSLRIVRRRGGLTEARQRWLARAVGCCAKTVGAVLKRLCSGWTVGVRRRRRRPDGKPGTVQPWLEIVKEAGRACWVRVLGEREAAASAPAPEAETAPRSKKYVPSDGEVADMIRVRHKSGLPTPG